MFEWYWVFLFYLFMLHVKVAVFTVYVHRGYYHNAVEFTRTGDEIFKFLTWTVREFVSAEFKSLARALHIKHHVKSDTEQDPHSPHYFSVYDMIVKRDNFPALSATDPYYATSEEIEKYGKGPVTENTWLDTNLYERFKKYGIVVWYPIIFFLYGPAAFIISLFVVPVLFNEFYVIFGNYIYHVIGYRTQAGNKGSDKSTNLIPLGLVFSGEELHSNHHAAPGRAKLSMRWFEFDLGWLYIRILSFIGLIRVKKH